MSTALARIGRIDNLKELLKKRAPEMADALPRHLTMDRMIRVACAAASRQPLLLECTPLSLLQALMQAVQLGLEPGGALGHCYLVPFKNNTKVNGEWVTRYEATFIVGYRGLIDLARRSGHIASIEAHAVHQNDEFDLEFGLEPKLKHRPCLDRDAGPMVFVYAIARFKDGNHMQYDVMTKSQIDAIRARSKSADKGPWVTDYDEMARKTVVKRLAKYLPLSVELADLIEADNHNEYDAGEIPFGLEGSAEVVPLEDGGSRTEEAKRRLQGVHPSLPEGEPAEDDLAGLDSRVAEQQEAGNAAPVARPQEAVAPNDARHGRHGGLRGIRGV